MLKKETEIKRMSEVINSMSEQNAHYYGKNMQKHEAFADSENIANALYNAGYRQKDEIIRIFFAGVNSILEREKELERTADSTNLMESMKHSYAIGVYEHLQKLIYEMGYGFSKGKENVV